MFKGRDLVIATKHNKEKVIAPILKRELGVNCIVIPDLDTDELGTFTGEVERKEDPIATARKKCLTAMKLAKCDMAVASEGSFGPHPSLFFVHADDEFLLFIDKKNKLEIIVREISTQTNFNSSFITSKNELAEFAKNVKFPSHGLIVRKTDTDFNEIEKGIKTWTKLSKVYTHFIKQNGSFYVETDMRALHNPSRMKVIQKATTKLASKINSNCPGCNTPGFEITALKHGLPCLLCRLPTRSTLSQIYSCHKCSFSKEEHFPNNKNSEDPTFCDNCNP
ncbi:DUF6671 family protein [uncultured Flavobacterium sp.]|uniref:DUF6671 family protein n=1 Tax=uncultured Flavobacterium sp. TaxID=165435 RepID=UPI0030CA3DBC